MIRRRSDTPLATVLCVLVVSVLVFAGAAGAISLSASPVAAESPHSIDSSTVTAQTDDNETIPHEDPATAAESGDDDEVAAYLAGQLNEMLGGSSQSISEGQYEAAREQLGDDYDDTLAQYVDVAGDTDQADTADSYTQARDRTREVTELREEYEDTFDAYEQAVADGDEERARELARELVTLAEDLEEISADLDELFDEIEATTGADLSETRDTVRSVSDETSSSAANVSTAELTPTELTVSANATVSSFNDPVRITGTVHTDEGDLLSEDTVRISVGKQTHTVELNATGGFVFTYRPVFVPVTDTTVPVTYHPSENSPYVGANKSIEANITEQVTPTVSLADVPTVQYNDVMPFTGAVTINGLDAPADVPIALRADGQQLTTTTTAANGTFNEPTQLPATIASGSTSVSADIELTDTAVTSATTTTPLTVEETATELSIDTETEGNETPVVTVTGTLQTTTGETLGDHDVTVSIGDTQVDTVTTAPDGTYEATLSPTALPRETADPVIRTHFDGTGTNLASTDATTTATLPSAFVTTELSFFGLSQLQLLSIAGITALLISGLLITLVTNWGPNWHRRFNTPTDTTQQAQNASTTDTASTDKPIPQATSLIEQAEQSLANNDTEIAVQLAYTSIRTVLTPQIADADGSTHWEFYTKCARNTLDEEALTHLETATTAYETAVFSPSSPPADRAETVLHAATTLTQTETSAT